MGTKSKRSKEKKVLSKSSIRYSEMNVDNVLNEPKLYAVFYEWAIANLCSENLSFYADADQFKKLEDSALIQKEAMRIYLKFIKENSYNQINLDFETKRDINLLINNGTPHKGMFVPAQCMIMELIKYDLLVKFMDSDNYRIFKGLPVPHNESRLLLPRKNLVKRVEEMPHVCAASISKLENCLVDPIAMKEFLSFSKEEFSDSLLLFYLDVQKFREAPTPEFATKIYNTFLSEASDTEVDADPKIKKQIWKTIQSGSVTGDLFDKLQTQVFAVMAQDNFFRFQLKMISRLAIN